MIPSIQWTFQLVCIGFKPFPCLMNLVRYDSSRNCLTVSNIISRYIIQCIIQLISIKFYYTLFKKMILGTNRICYKLYSSFLLGLAYCKEHEEKTLIFNDKALTHKFQKPHVNLGINR